MLRLRHGYKVRLGPERSPATRPQRRCPRAFAGSTACISDLTPDHAPPSPSRVVSLVRTGVTDGFLAAELPVPTDRDRGAATILLGSSGAPVLGAGIHGRWCRHRGVDTESDSSELSDCWVSANSSRSAVQLGRVAWVGYTGYPGSRQARDRGAGARGLGSWVPGAAPHRRAPALRVDDPGTGRVLVEARPGTEEGCRRGDLNPYALFGHQALNLARLPIPPLRRDRLSTVRHRG